MVSENYVLGVLLGFPATLIKDAFCITIAISRLISIIIATQYTWIGELLLLLGVVVRRRSEREAGFVPRSKPGVDAIVLSHRRWIF